MQWTGQVQEGVLSERDLRVVTSEVLGVAVANGHIGGFIRIDVLRGTGTLRYDGRDWDVVRVGSRWYLTGDYTYV